LKRLTRLAFSLALAAAAGVAAALVAARIADGPLGPLPGGRLRGAEQPCPAQGFAGHAAARSSELEVRPERPRSVRTWNVVVDDRLYLPADFLTPWKRWPYQVQRDPRVRLRIDGDLYACRAVRVLDPDELARVRAAAAAKYAIGPDDRSARTEIWWFRLEPREAPGGPTPDSVNR
jgi:hypothetical protein